MSKKHKGDRWDVVLGIVIVLSIGVVILEPRLDSNITQHRNLLDFNSIDDPTPIYTVETTGDQAQYMLGILSFTTTVAKWVQGATIILMFLNALKYRAGWGWLQ